MGALLHIHCTGCAKKKERHFKYIDKIANN